MPPSHSLPRTLPDRSVTDRRSLVASSAVARLFTVVTTLVVVASATGCTATYERRDPTGEPFPTVQGIALDETAWRLPDDLDDEPALLLLGYEMEAQFDLDRWLLGIFDAGVDLPVYEVPTIVGMIPGWISGTINEGMRGGIPPDDWAQVITVYRDAPLLAAFTGNAGPANGRILLLDGASKVRFFHDEGYSVGALDSLRKSIEGLAPSSTEE